ncbi:MAG: hypothetical protein WBV82_12325 [Myxococcaceae bacterium]
MNTDEEVKRLGEQVAVLRSELAQLRSRGNHGSMERQYEALPTVPEAEVRKLEEVIEAAIKDPREGLARENKQYARPVLEVLAATTGLRFGDSPDLPPVKEIPRKLLTALRAEEFDESKLDWDSSAGPTH